MSQENLSPQPMPLSDAAVSPFADLEPAPRPPAAARRALGALTALLLAAATLAAYWRAFDCGFVNYDDNAYVYERDEVKGGLTWDHFKWAFTTTETVNWYPLTWISLQLDANIWGGVGRPFGFHLTNVILHVADTLLLFWVLRRMTGRTGRSAVVAGLFALHPLHVESVAWVTERKDVLSALFWMLALAAYVWYAERPRRSWRYLLVIAAFTLGLLAKSMLVTLPCVLFLLDFWPLRRYPPQTRRGAEDDERPDGFRPGRVSWLQLIAEKVPLLVLAAASTGMTVYAQAKGGESNPIEAMPLRIENALISYVTYIGKTVWPVGLVIYYPFPSEARGVTLSPYEAIMAGLLLLAVTVLAAATARRRPYFLMGWLWFLGTLTPVIGLVQVLGDYSMADRFTYIPLIGLFIAATWGAADGLARAGVWPWLSAAAAVVVLAAFAAGTWQQVGYWHDNDALWKHTLAVNPRNHLAYNNLGHARLMDGGKVWAEIRDAQRRGAPVPADSYRLADAKYAEAEWYFRMATQCDPSYALSHYSLACTLEEEGKGKEAEAELLAAGDAEPGNALYQCRAASVLVNRGQFREANSRYEDVLRAHPDDFDAHLGLGWALLQAGDAEGALAQFQAAVRENKDSAQAHEYLARALLSRGDVDGAIAEFREALRIDPDDADAHDFLATALARQGDAVGGGREWAEAQRLRQPP